jgi:peroxiredoxin
VTAEVDYRERGPKIGAIFPDIRLPDQRGDPVDLHRHRDGRRAVVVFNRSAVW